MPLHVGAHRAARTRRRGWRRRPFCRRGRLFGLAGVVACAVVLPFAVASAGPADDGATASAGAVGAGEPGRLAPASKHGQAAGARLLPVAGDGKAPGGAGAAPPSSAGSGRTVLPPGLATAVRCGPELTSPEGFEAQTCVLTQGTETWARTYYRNVTGVPVETALSLLGPGGRSVRTVCAVGAEDAPGMCETPRERMRGEPAEYTAVAEVAGRAGYGPLLLRTGSNSRPGTAG
ncbi:hypothetical protein [Streptomyces sp. NPDC047725]|uniref:hypothetical protein n=1 Tax=Streptomyces sp. NPDC047725 TaxID=3365487 RepID=UPI0037150407